MSSEKPHGVLPVDHVYLINLDRRADRLESVTKQLSRVGIEFERVPAVDCRDTEFLRYSWANSKIDKARIKTPGALGCLMSHANVICNAFMRGYKSIAVFEDDVLMHREFEFLAEKLPKLSEEIPLFYLGATQVEWDGISREGETYRAHNTYGTFAMMIHESIYKDLLDAYGTLLEPADDAICRFIQPYKNCLVATTNLCAADVRDSDIRGDGNQSSASRIAKWDMENYFLDGAGFSKSETDWIRDITIGISHFDRPEHLNRLIASIRDAYPRVRIVVADNSKIHRDLQLPGGAELIQLPPDEGVCACRNACADACRTKYLLQLEEDFIFTQETDLRKFWEVLEGDQLAGIVGGSLWGKGNLHDYATDFSVFDKTIFFRPASGAWETINGVPCRPCDMVFDFYLARREVLLACRWDKSLVIGGEHPDYFLRLKEHGRWRVLHTPVVRATHDFMGRDEHYRAHRERSREFLSLFISKHNFRDMVVDRRLNWRHSPDGCISRPNIIIHGAPHSGCTTAAKIISKLGWNTAYTVDEKFNTPMLRDINKRLIAGENHTGTRKEMLAFVMGQRQPWMIKDTQFSETIDKWFDVLSEYGQGTREYPFLLSIRRDRQIIEQRAEMARRNGDPPTRVREIVRKVETDFGNWPWGKLEIDYEQISEAAGSFTRKGFAFIDGDA